MSSSLSDLRVLTILYTRNSQHVVLGPPREAPRSCQNYFHDIVRFIDICMKNFWHLRVVTVGTVFTAMHSWFKKKKASCQFLLRISLRKQNRNCVKSLPLNRCLLNTPV